MPKVSPKAGRDPLAGREVELKLLLDPKALGEIKAMPLIGRPLAKAKPARLTTTYFDTEDRRLKGAGLTMRIRRTGAKRVLTVKQIGKAAIGRAEWERPVKADRPAAADYAASPAGAVLGTGEDASLSPLFTASVRRGVAMIGHGGSRIEVALDRGTIACGEVEMPVCEIELELKSGLPRDVIALARKLVALVPLHLSFVSKAERGLRLADGEWGKPQRATAPALHAGMSALTAFLAIGRTCLQDFMLNEPALAAGDDIEGVHQARIAIRRLRAAFSLFSPLIAHPQFKALAGELKFLSDLLGAARDCDVLMSEFSVDPQSALGIAVTKRRGAARQALTAGLASSRMRLFRIDLAAWLDESGWTLAQGRPLSGSVCDMAAGLLARRLKKLRRRARHLRSLDAQGRHRVRIAAKKLRYMCEFFDSLLDDKRSKRRFDRLTGTLEKMQESLGALQDETTYARLVGEILGEAEARRLALASPNNRKAELRKALKAAARLKEIKPFWLEWQPDKGESAD